MRARFRETCLSMLSGTTGALSSVQHLHRCLAWCVSHINVLSIRKNGEYFSGVPPTSQSGRPISVFHRPVVFCSSARGQAPADMYGTPDPGFISKTMSTINGAADQKLELSSITKSAPSPAVTTFCPQGWESPGAKWTQIFCNRSLNMKSIVAVGFDMDYTLAQYKAETFETLAYTGSVNKLVNDLGYPKEMLNWTFDWRYMVRGLVIDKKRGNILKMDRHKYVKVAHHGFQVMSREDRATTYGNALSRESFDEPDYALIDTLFALAGAYLFAQLVELKDSKPEIMPPGSDYYHMYGDVRAAVDMCHRDGTLKLAVAIDPGKYINEDQKIMPMLKMLRESGRLTFLATNSLWEYTDVVMNYLFGKTGTKDGVPRDHDWLNYFDLVITGSAKPGFFKDGNHAPLFEVDVASTTLLNTDNGSPLTKVRDEVALQTFQNGKPKQGCRVFQGGGVAHLHNLLAIEASAQVLYVGDHIYGDILRSKKALGWRTMLVVPELEKELNLLEKTADIHKKVQKLRMKRNVLEDTLHQLEWKLKHAGAGEDKNALESKLKLIQIQRDTVREEHRQAQRECHHEFHDVWGQLMKTGYQNSRFAHQVERFACLYTCQVTNLYRYSPEKCYRTREDYMPHEMDVYSV